MHRNTRLFKDKLRIYIYVYVNETNEGGSRVMAKSIG